MAGAVVVRDVSLTRFIARRERSDFSAAAVAFNIRLVFSVRARGLRENHRSNPQFGCADGPKTKTGPAALSRRKDLFKSVPVIDPA